MYSVLLVDVSNIYYCVKKVHKGRKLSYQSLMDYVNKITTIKRSIAYGASLGDQAQSFIDAIEKCGFETKFKEPRTYNTKMGIKRKADWDVGIAIDMVKFALGIGCEKATTIFLASADGDMAEAVEFCRENGVKVFIMGANISSNLKDAANEAIEIPQSLLEKPRPRRKLEVSSPDTGDTDADEG